MRVNVMPKNTVQGPGQEGVEGVGGGWGRLELAPLDPENSALHVTITKATVPPKLHFY